MMDATAFAEEGRQLSTKRRQEKWNTSENWTELLGL